MLLCDRNFKMQKNLIFILLTLVDKTLNKLIITLLPYLKNINREPIIPEKNSIRIEKYITGFVNNNASKLYANRQQVHFLISCASDISEETIATIIAGSSERFINENYLTKGHFAWQKTASVFSVSKSDVNSVCKYILN